MFTLVRHNLWAMERFPRYRRGLEPLRVGPLTALRLYHLGGVILPDAEEAWDAAEGFMYPGGDTTLMADPFGSFLEIPFLGRHLFVPEFSGSLIAA